MVDVAIKKVFVVRDEASNFSEALSFSLPAYPIGKSVPGSAKATCPWFSGHVFRKKSVMSF